MVNAAPTGSGTVRGVIFDIEGTLTEGGRACPGGVELLRLLRANGVKVGFLTNMTGKTPGMIAESLQSAGIEAGADEIHTAVTVCAKYLARNMRGKKGFFALPEATRAMLSGFGQCVEAPDYVVLGDLDEGFRYELLNRIFNYLADGAELIAFHRNAFYFKGGRKQLDSGMFTAGLEAATGKSAVITGKPSALAFGAALEAMNEPGGAVLAVGDDISTDISGAVAAGLRGVLVGTGKFRPEHLEARGARPDYFVPSLVELACLLREWGTLKTVQ